MQGLTENESGAVAVAEEVAALVAQARATLADGDEAAACAQLDAALAAARKDPDSTRRGLLQRGLGDLHAAGGRLDAALRQYEDAITALRLAGATAAEADTWLSAGDAQRALLRPDKAAQAYTNAAALFATLDDPHGGGHSQFRLAGLAGAERKDVAEAHYARAVERYTEAADRQSRGLRLTNPHLPDVVEDSRREEAWIMANVAQREIARLNPEPESAGPELPPLLPLEDVVPSAEAAPLASPPPPPPPPVAVAAAKADAALQRTAAVVGAVTLLFATLVVLITPWTGHAMLVAAAAALLAGTVAAFWLHKLQLASPYFRHAAPLLAVLLVLSSGALHSPQLIAPPPPLAAVDAPPPSPVVELSPIEAQRAAFEREVAAAEARGDRRAEADALRRFGEFEQAQAERQRCLVLLARSYELYRATAAPQPAAEVATVLGDVLLRTHRLDPARQRYDTANALYSEVHDDSGRGRALRKRGDAEGALRRWRDAHGSYSEALALVQQLGDAEGEIELTLRLAAAEAALQQPDAARPLFERAQRLALASRTAVQARVWLALADFEAGLEREGPALRAYERAVTLAGAARDGGLEARGLRHRASYEQRRGRLASARGTVELAVRAARAREAATAEALGHLDAAAVAQQMGDAQAARDQYASAQALYEQQPHPIGAPRVALGLGDLEAGLGRVEAAQTSYALALELARQADHVGLQIAALERLTTLLAAKDRVTADQYGQRAATLRAEVFGAAAQGAA